MKHEDSKFEAAHASVVSWLHSKVVQAARGDHLDAMTHAPAATFWLGRLAPVDTQVATASRVSREERLDPCAFGMRVHLNAAEGLAFRVEVSCRCWSKEKSNWRKSQVVMAS